MLKKKFIMPILICILFLCACGSENPEPAPEEVSGEKELSEASFDGEKFKEDMIKAAYSLDRSPNFSVAGGLYVTGLGMGEDYYPLEFNESYLFPAIEAMTGVHFAIDWKSEANYSTAVATTILTSKDNLPDLISPKSFGIMDLADDNIIIPLDDYLDLMPDIVAAMGEDNIDNWREEDGHIYTIPSVSSAESYYTTYIRKDWLDELGMEVPNSWNEWVEYWRAVLKTDLNHNGDSNDEVPVAFPYAEKGERAFVPLLNAFGIETSYDGEFCYLEDGTYTLIYEHPRYKDFLEEMAKLYAEGIIYKDFEIISEDYIIDLMDTNRVGSVMTSANTGLSAQALRNAGDTDALWKTTKPVPGPYGNRLIPEKKSYTDSWCITVAAQKNGKVKDLIRFFNWCYTQEGLYLFNYGIENVSYDIVDGQAQIKNEVVEEGFKYIKSLGLNNEEFVGHWLEEACLQYIFGGKNRTEFTDIQEEVYKAMFEINKNFYYRQPDNVETKTYVKYRTNLITSGVCSLRDQTVKGEKTVTEFFAGYKNLYLHGLKSVCDEAMAK